MEWTHTKEWNIALITCSNSCYHQHYWHSNKLGWCDCMHKEQYSQLNVMGMHPWLQWMQFNLIFCRWCPQTGQIIEQSIISLQQTTVLFRYLVAPSKPCKWSGVLAQAIQLTAVHDVDVTLHVLSDFGCTLQWTNRNITTMISSVSYSMGTISCFTLHALFNF